MAIGSKTGGEERGSDSGRGGAMRGAMGSISIGRGGGVDSGTDKGGMGSITIGEAMGSITGGGEGTD